MVVLWSTMREVLLQILVVSWNLSNLSALWSNQKGCSCWRSYNVKLTRLLKSQLSVTLASDWLLKLCLHWCCWYPAVSWPRPWTAACGGRWCTTTQNSAQSELPRIPAVSDPCSLKGTPHQPESVCGRAPDFPSMQSVSFPSSLRIPVTLFTTDKSENQRLRPQPRHTTLKPTIMCGVSGMLTIKWNPQTLQGQSNTIAANYFHYQHNWTHNASVPQTHRSNGDDIGNLHMYDLSLSDRYFLKLWSFEQPLVNTYISGLA